MTTLTPQPPRVPLGTTDNGRPVFITREWLNYLAVQLFDRVGGTDGPSNNELVVSDDDDAGLEELKASVYRLANDAGQTPPAELQQRVEFLETRLAELVSLVSEVSKEINDIKQGTLL